MTEKRSSDSEFVTQDNKPNIRSACSKNVHSGTGFWLTTSSVVLYVQYPQGQGRNWCQSNSQMTQFNSDISTSIAISYLFLIARNLTSKKTASSPADRDASSALRPEAARARRKARGFVNALMTHSGH